MSLSRNYKEKKLLLMQFYEMSVLQIVMESVKDNHGTVDIYNNDNAFKCHPDRITFCSFQLVIVLRMKESARTRHASVNTIDAVSFKTLKIFRNS